MFWACLNRLFHIIQGRLVYLLALLDIPLEVFEKQRFQLVRQQQRVEKTTTNSPTTFQQNAGIPPKPLAMKKEKKTLLISFAGSTFLVGGFPRAEFRTILTQAAKNCGIGHCASYLFLVDPSVTFYVQSSSVARKHQNDGSKWKGWDELVEKINQEIVLGQYGKVILVGSSMGATAILALCARFPCDAAIVFNPLVNFVEESRLRFWFGGQRLPSTIRTQMPQIMAEQCCTTSAKVIVHYSKESAEDMAQLAFLQDAIQARQQGAVGTPARDPILHLVGHDTAEHVLPRELKRRQQLLPVLEETLREVVCKEKDH